jgi:PAS domain S-box-containing protein
MHVIIIEEEQKIAEAIARVLLQNKMIDSWRQVSDLRQLEEALELPLDGILSSESAVDLSCLQALKMVRLRQLDILFILLTVQQNHQVAIECLKRGADDCVYRDQLDRLPAAFKSAWQKASERSQQKRMEKALLITKLAVDHAAMAMYWMSLDGRLMWANDAGLKLLGYSIKEIDQISIDKIDPGLTASVWREFVTTLRDKKSQMAEMRFQHKSGRSLSVEVTANLFESDGREYLLLFALDNAKRKNAEAENSRLVTAVEQAAESIMITDVKGHILYVNPAFERIAGYSRNEVAGKNANILKSGRHPRIFYNELWSTLTSGESWHGHFINRRKDGSLFEEEATISPIKNQRGKRSILSPSSAM